MTFLDVVRGLGDAGAFWLYAGFATAAFVFVYLLVPETKGVPLERIASLLESSKVAPAQPHEHSDSIVLIRPAFEKV